MANVRKITMVAVVFLVIVTAIILIDIPIVDAYADTQNFFPIEQYTNSDGILNSDGTTNELITINDFAIAVQKGTYLTPIYK